MIDLRTGDCIEVMKTLPDNSVDSVVTDPPYGIRFMGAAWDGADIEKRHAVRANALSEDGFAGATGGHKSISAEAGKYELTPAAMRSFQNFSEAWAREAFRVLKPGGHLLSFSSARTYHRMVCGIEDAGFEVRDQIMWVFGSGFPKSLDVSKAIDKAAGAERAVVGSKFGLPGYRTGATGGNEVYGTGLANGDAKCEITAPATSEAQQWQGWGTALKPAHEPICVARKPLDKGNTVAANVLHWGTGALNIDACRVETESGGRPLREVAALRDDYEYAGNALAGRVDGSLGSSKAVGSTDTGRWPANLIHSGEPEVLALFPDSSVTGKRSEASQVATVAGTNWLADNHKSTEYTDAGSAARFFYCAKASKKDRDEGLDGFEAKDREARYSSIQDARPHTAEGYEYHREKRANTHPTVKPVDLMKYLCRLVTPPGGVVLDPFMGSGSTGKAAALEGFRFIGIDLDPAYVEISRARIAHAAGQADAPVEIKQVGTVKTVTKKLTPAANDNLDLFAEVA
jgi:DNA modification methylase